MTDQKDFLNRPRADIHALQPRLGVVLHLEGIIAFAAPHFDPTGNNSADVRAVADDFIQNRIQPADPAMLTLDPAELHGRRIMRRAPISQSPAMMAARIEIYACAEYPQSDSVEDRRRS